MKKFLKAKRLMRLLSLLILAWVVLFLISPSILSPSILSPSSPQSPANNVSSIRLPECPEKPPHLRGFHKAMEVDKPMEDLEREWGDVLNQGSYKPLGCVPENRTAILIPCRNRWAHLRALLNHLIPFLIRQQLSFTLFVIESDQISHFNKGVLLNAGYLEAMKLGNYSCFIMNDVDLLPLNDYNLYRCGHQPRHLAVAVDKWMYKMLYSDLFGGALAFTPELYERVNGHSNAYFGWGGEDDDFRKRVESKGYSIQRLPLNMSQYHMIQHGRDKGNEMTALRLVLNSDQEVTKRMASDGLRQVLYQKDWIRFTPLYVWIKITVNQTKVIQNLPDYVRAKFKNGKSITVLQ